MTTAACVCGHDEARHEHYRNGTDCGVVVAARNLVSQVGFTTSDLFKDLVRAVNELDGK